MMDKNLLPPEERPLAEHLESLAQRMTPDAYFERGLEKRLVNNYSPEPKSKGFLAQALPTLGWAVGLVLLALTLNWVLRSIAPQPAAFGTPTSSQDAPLPNETLPTPKPAGEAYDWNGMQLYLQAELPTAPTEAGIYLVQPEQHATLESARALARRFGMSGPIYETPPELGGSKVNDFLVVDGNQRMQVRSDLYFTYYPDYTHNSGSFAPAQYPNAETVIKEFLASKGFDFEYKIEPAELYGAYFLQPLTPDGRAIHYEYFATTGWLFSFDKDGLLSVGVSLVNYTPVGTDYGIMSAEEAFQKLIDPQAASGTLMGQGSPPQNLTARIRPRPENQTVTVWGWITSFKSLEGNAPLVSLDGYTATGNLAGLAELTPNTFVEATGQFQTVDGAKTFNVESWKIYEGYEDGVFGTLQRDEEKTVIVSDRGTFILPDVPADLPLPMENAYATGIVSGGIFEWKTLDNRSGRGGGGGGGGGLGFYKLNLTGTPVPLPTPVPTPQGGDGYTYIVAAGDTCESIATTFNVTVEELISINHLPVDCSTLHIDQALVILPNMAPPEPQRVEGLRGLLNVTIYEKADGSQRATYGFLTDNPGNPYITLEGDNLQELQKYNNRPIKVWGQLSVDEYGQTVLKAERFEVLFPDLQFQILKGVEKSVEVQGQTVLLFTAEDGKNYVELAPNCYDVISTESVVGTGQEGESILLEALAVPDLSFGEYPAICVFSTAMAISPKNGQPMELTVMADQPNVVPEPPSAAAGDLPTLTIEKVELVYYTSNQRYLPPDPNAAPVYIQPVWRFYGHYSDGSIFEALIQALDTEFLLPETEDYTAPG
jgi:LysM repeat protein